MFKVIWSAVFISLVSFSFIEKSQARFCNASNRSSFLATLNNSAHCGRTCSVYGVYTIQDIQIKNGAVELKCSFYGCWNGLSYGSGGGLFTTGCSTNLTVSKAITRVTNPINQCGSIIHTPNQVLGEVIPVMGASFTLNYFSNRVIGRTGDYKINIPISPETVLGMVTGYYLEIKNDLAVTIHSASFGTSTNQSTTFTSNGLNGSGQETWGTIKYSIRVEEQATDTNFDATKMDMNIGNLKNKKLGLGSWVPSIWYFYDVNSKTLYKPDGTERSVEAESLTGGFYRVADEDGNLVHIFDSMGKIIETKLGLTGQVVYSFYYDGSDKLSYINEPFSKTTTFNRNGSGVLTSIVAPNGKVTTVTHDGNGYLATITNPNSEVYEMTYYGSGGLLETFEKPTGIISEFTYDGEGSLIKDEHSGGYYVELDKTTNPNGNIEVLSTTVMGRENLLLGSSSGSSSYKQENLKADGSKYIFEYTPNQIQKYSYNDSSSEASYILDTRFGNTSTKKNYTWNYRFGNRLTSFNNNITYSISGDPFAINTWTKTRTIGFTSKYPITSVYTGSTKTTVSTTQLGKTSTTEIDSYQRPVSVQQGNLTPIDMTYTDDKLTEISQGARTTTFAYNSTSKLLESVTNALNQTTEYEYNDAERLIKTTLPDSREINYIYDSQGNLTSITPPSKPAHTMRIGGNEKLSSYNPPTLTGVPTVNTTYTYNLDNQLTEIARPNGQSIVYDYGATTGRLNKITVPDGDFTYTYGLLGSYISLPTQIVAPSGQKVDLNYNYGALYNTHVKNSNNTTVYNFSANAGDHSQLGSESISGASGSFSLSYYYNNDEYLSQVGNIVLSYNTPNGQLSGTVLGNLNDAWSYNTFGELEEYEFKYTSTPLYKTELTRDDLGRVSQKIETLNGVTSTYDYTYDTAGRLTEVKKDTVTIATYTYDSNSNRNGGDNGSTITATYDDQDRMTAYKNYTFTYNANGDLTSSTNTSTSQTVTYTYDIFGNLKEVVLPSKTISYEIDPLNRRLGRKDNGTVQKRYVYDTKNRLVAEMSSANALTRRYVYGSKAHVPDYFYDTSNVKYRIVTDHLGSVRLVVKESDGTVMQRMEHDEFGRIITDTNPGYQPFGFAGGIYDPETALIRFGARDYMPSAGRWTSKDPIRFSAGDTNLFGYVFSDPVNFTDPSGLEVGYVQLSLSYGAASPAYSNRGSNTTAAIGLGYDTNSGRVFSFNSIGRGSETYGAFGGISAGVGIFTGSQDQFLGAGISTSANVGVGLVGAGFSVSGSGNERGYQFDLFGPGFGIGVFNQQNQCGGN